MERVVFSAPQECPCRGVGLSQGESGLPLLHGQRSHHATGVHLAPAVSSRGSGDTSDLRQASGGVSRRGRKAVCCVAYMHTSRLSRALEYSGENMGLPVSRISLCPRRQGDCWSRATASAAHRGECFLSHFAAPGRARVTVEYRTQHVNRLGPSKPVSLEGSRPSQSQGSSPGTREHSPSRAVLSCAESRTDGGSRMFFPHEAR